MARYEGTTTEKGYILRLDVDEVNVDTANNRSKASWTLWIVNGYKDGIYARFNANFTYSASINGTTVASYSGNVNTTDVDPGQPHKLASGTTDWIGHNADGSKTISCSAECSGGGPLGPGTGSCSGSLALTTIKRAATINSLSGDDIDGNFAVGYTKYVNDWSYYLRLSIPGIGGQLQIQRILYNTSGETFRLTDSAKDMIYDQIKNADTVSISAVIETYNGKTKIGESSAKTNTCKVNRNIWLNVNGTWKRGIPYVKVNGEWKVGVPYIKNNGEWKKAI